MPSTTAPEIRCSIQRTLDVLGEKWTLLIVREAFWGRTRFAQFRERLGIAPDMLTDRLRKLVDWGIVEKAPYRDASGREREEYLLTSAGRDLAPVLASLARWGDTHRPTGHGPASAFRDAATGDELQVLLVADGDRPVDPEHAELVPGPGALTDPRVSRA